MAGTPQLWFSKEKYDIHMIYWLVVSMDWFKGKFTGIPHSMNGKIMENLWFPVKIFPRKPIH
jgi:hypothetical protein